MAMARLRELLMKSACQGIELESLGPTETVYQAIIIRDFMKAKGIAEVRQGMRAFFAFQRERLQQMGWISGLRGRRGAEAQQGNGVIYETPHQI